MFLLVATIAMVLAEAVSLPRPVHAGPMSGCLPEDQLNVTVLVRSAGGRFDGLDTGDANPYIDARSSTTWLPARALMTALSPGSDPIRWYEEDRTATLWYGNHTLEITFTPRSNHTYSATLDGRAYSMHSFLCDGRLWVPARRLVEAFGIDIQYFPADIVVVDAVGGSGSSGDSNPPGRARQASIGIGESASAGLCSAYPNDPIAYIKSPIRSIRQISNHAACRVQTY